MENDASPMITILIAEDYEVNRLGLKLLLDNVSDFSVVGEATNGEKCVQLAIELKPSIVLMDVRMPVLNGIDATRQIKQYAVDTRIIMLTSHSDHAEIVSSLEAGADGYCLKEVRSQQLIAAIRAVDSGACWLDPGIANLLLKALPRLPETQKSVELTDIEINILKLIVKGLSNQEIAKQLYLGHDSVRSQVRRILEKLMVDGRTQAAVKAVRDGLI